MTRILTKFTIAEISAVDKPAQEGARVVILKRAQPVGGFNKHDAAHGGRSMPETLEAAAREIAKRDGVGKAESWRRARSEHPNLFAKHQVDVPAAVPVAKVSSRAAQDFHLLAEGIRQRDRVPRNIAMQRARKEHPAAYAALQAAS